MPNFDYLKRPLSQIFYKYGQIIAKHPLPLIFFPLFISMFAIIGFISLDSTSDALYLFTPANAQSKMERQAIHDLWPLVNGSYIPGRAVTQSREVQITVSAKDPNGNILEQPYSSEVELLDAIIQNVTVEHNGRFYRYRDLCLQWRNQGCPGNKHVKAVADLYQHGINITYPIIKFGSIHAYIGSSLGGVAVGYGKNDSVVLRKAHSWLMVYHLQFYPHNISFLSGLWEKQFQQTVQNFTGQHITITYLHSQTLAEEFLAPRFVFAFVILLIFTVICNMSTCRSSWYIDWAVSKPILAILGVTNAGMGIVTAIGYLNLCSVPYNNIVGVMPFFVIAIGVDNMFLMIAAIRRTNRASSVDQRMGQAMRNTTTSMLITALLDALLFGVGTITTIPAIQIFCIYTGAAITVTFIYQITFFAGLLALSIRWEARGYHSLFMRAIIPEGEANEHGLLTRLFWLGSTQDVDRLVYDMLLSDVNEEGLRELDNITGITNLSEEDFPANPFPVEGEIYFKNNRLMISLVCHRKINPQKTIRVWFIIDTGSPATYLAEKTIDALGAPNDPIISPLWVAIQDKNNRISCHLSPRDGNFPEANVLGMEALLQLKVSIDLTDSQNHKFRLMPYQG